MTFWSAEHFREKLFKIDDITSSFTTCTQISARVGKVLMRTEAQNNSARTGQKL